MITFEHVTKRFGPTTAVDDLCLQVHPGRVTALLGPNGAGKSTSLRVLLGLDRATEGQALVDGRPYRSLDHPLRVVGAHLGGRSVHPGRSARSHLRALARAGGVPARRVDEVLEAAGIARVARRRAGSFSLGMGQRLGIAAAMLGDPAVVVLDEPVNGLDTDGVAWIRAQLRRLAEEGRTVLVSSHVLSEVQHSTDQVVVLGRGRLLADCPTSQLTASGSRALVLRTPDPDLLDRFCALLPGAGVARGSRGDRGGEQEVRLSGVGPEAVGEAARQVGLRVHHLAPEEATLEDGYRRLVAGDVEFTATVVR